jgi:hypothetical protein
MTSSGGTNVGSVYCSPPTRNVLNAIAVMAAMLANLSRDDGAAEEPTRRGFRGQWSAGKEDARTESRSRQKHAPDLGRTLPTIVAFRLTIQGLPRQYIFSKQQKLQP